MDTWSNKETHKDGTDNMIQDYLVSFFRKMTNSKLLYDALSLGLVPMAGFTPRQKQQ